MPLNYRKSRTTTVYGPTENELKKRNNTVRKVFNAKGIPRNMGNKEILGRVKVYNNVMTRKNILNYHYNPKPFHVNEGRKKIANFISNGRVFNQRKREALVELMLRFDISANQLTKLYNKQSAPQVDHIRLWEILALKNENVIRYIKYMADYFGADGVYKRRYANSYVPHSIVELMYKGRYGFRGPIREDPGAVRVLKKRTAFLKEMLKIRGYTDRVTHLNNRIFRYHNWDNLPRNMQNEFRPDRNVTRRDMWKYMLKKFPLPPHPKNAATKIQAAVRGMINRTTVKKMKTAAGKRKASTSIKTTSPKRTKTNR